MAPIESSATKEEKLMKALLHVPGTVISGSVLLKRNFLRAYKEKERRPKEVLTAAFEELEKRKLGHVQRFLGRNPVRLTINLIVLQLIF